MITDALCILIKYLNWKTSNDKIQYGIIIHTYLKKIKLFKRITYDSNILSCRSIYTKFSNQYFMHKP